jgi:hypothetical protein
MFWRRSLRARHIKVKIPTDGGLHGPYNHRSYNGVYLLKGGGPKVWKLFPRIKREWRRPQGIIFGKRCRHYGEHRTGGARSVTTGAKSRQARSCKTLKADTTGSRFQANAGNDPFSIWLPNAVVRLDPGQCGNLEHEPSSVGVGSVARGLDPDLDN